MLSDGPLLFPVTVLQPLEPVRTALFSVGRGGNPARHRPLLEHLASQGCTVIAPHFEPLATPIPVEQELLSRARRLQLAIKAFAQPDLPIAGIGHSIGATMLIALAGGQAQTLAGKRLSPGSKIDFDRLALFTPATDFFRAPGALDRVNTPVLAWAGAEDVITPPRQVEFLRDALKSRMKIGVHIVEHAGHFTFMNELPPHIVDPYPNRSEFLANLADEVSRFLAA